jgi:hypothetical protein
MSPSLKQIISQIEALNQNEKLKVFQYLAQELEAPKSTPNQSNYDALVQYIEDCEDQESDRSLLEFKGISPDLLEGQDAQNWVNQQRNEWGERQALWE